jgi:hypothetical protein
MSSGASLPSGPHDPSNNAPGYTQDPSDIGISGENHGLGVARNRVTINLHINVDVSGNVDIFTASGEALVNVVPASVGIDVSALYVDSSNAALRYYEPSGIDADISGFVDASNAFATGSDMYLKFASDMQNVVQHALDASGAAPFNEPQYSGLSKCQEFSSLGHLVLGLYAHYLFGHVAATAAIDNDDQLVAYLDASGSSNADVGTHLAQALNALPNHTASRIVQQIIAQDPSRSRGKGNNQDQDEGVIFASGDVIFVQITVDAPSLTVGESTTGGPVAYTLTNLVGSAFPTPSPVITLRVVLN